MRVEQTPTILRDPVAIANEVRGGLEQPRADTDCRARHFPIEQPHHALLGNVLSHIRVTGEPLAVPDQSAIVLIERRVEIHGGWGLCTGRKPTAGCTTSVGSYPADLPEVVVRETSGAQDV